MHRDRRTRPTAADGAGGAGLDDLDGRTGDGGRTESVAGAITYRVSGTPLRVWVSDSELYLDGNASTISVSDCACNRSTGTVCPAHTGYTDTAPGPDPYSRIDTDSDSDVGTDA